MRCSHGVRNRGERKANVTPPPFISLDEEINAVKHFPIPMNQAVVQSFLGLTGYFRKFISICIYCVDELAEKNAKFCFADIEKCAFEQLL